MDIVLFPTQCRQSAIQREVNCVYFSLSSARQIQMQPGTKARHANTNRGHSKNIRKFLWWMIVHLWIKSQSNVSNGQRGAKSFFFFQFTNPLPTLTDITPLNFYFRIKMLFLFHIQFISYADLGNIGVFLNASVQETVDSPVCCCPRALTVCKTSASVLQHGNEMVRRKGHFVLQKTGPSFSGSSLVTGISPLGDGASAAHFKEETFRKQCPN